MFKYDVRLSFVLSMTCTHLWNTSKQPVHHSLHHNEDHITPYSVCTFWFTVSRLITFVVEPAFAGLQLLPTTAVTALVRDESPEVLLVCAIGQPECLAWALADDIRDCGGELLYLPIDLLLYYQSLIKKETGAPPSAAS